MRPARGYAHAVEATRPTGIMSPTDGVPVRDVVTDEIGQRSRSTLPHLRVSTRLQQRHQRWDAARLTDGVPVRGVGTGENGQRSSRTLHITFESAPACGSVTSGGMPPASRMASLLESANEPIQRAATAAALPWPPALSSYTSDGMAGARAVCASFAHEVAQLLLAWRFKVALMRWRRAASPRRRAASSSRL